MKTSKDKILVTIAARGGSKGVKNKNIRPLCGIPLIAHTISQARQWGRADAIICSTDSLDIAQVAREYGAQVPFMRPAELSCDTAGKVDVLRHALMAMEKISQTTYSVLIDVDVTAPIRKVSDIEGVYKLYRRNRPKTVFSVTPCRRNPYFNMVETDKRGYAVLSKQLSVVVKRRQDAPRVFDMNASIYAYDRGYLLDEQGRTAISDRSLVWVMDELSAFDIDTEADFKFVEFLVKEGLVNL